MDDQGFSQPTQPAPGQWQQQGSPVPQQQTGEPTKDDKTFALILWLTTFLTFIVPLVLWLVKKDESDYIDHHGKQWANLAITSLIIGVAGFILIFVIIGIFVLIAWGITALVFTVIAAIKAYEGERYVVPIAIPIFK